MCRRGEAGDLPLAATRVQHQSATRAAETAPARDPPRMVNYGERALIAADTEGGNTWRRTPVSQPITIERRPSRFAAGGAA